MIVLPDSSFETHLDMEEIGVVAGSARGLRQSIQPVPNGKTYYDVFGNIHHTGRPALRRYRTIVTGEDMWPPAFGGLEPGMTITVSCACEITQPAAVALVRPAVAGSIRWLDAESNDLPSAVGAKFVAFRPVLTCRVVDWDYDVDEDEQIVAWRIEMWEDGPGA